MKYLTLIRHAKSRRDEHGVEDHERTLAPRGIEDCAALATVLARELPVPARIATSSAVRARTTVEHLLAHLGRDRYPEPEVLPDLYLADAIDIAGVARELLAEDDEAWICAHNPGITEMVEYCTGSRIESVPTLGVARIEFDDELERGVLRFFDSPKNYR